MKLNYNSIRNKKHKLEQYLFTNKITICCLSETFLMRGEAFSVKNYNVIISDQNTRSGGVAILINKTIKFRVLAITSNLDSVEACGCEIFTNSGVLTVLSLYLPPKLNLSVSHLNSILNNIDFIADNDLVLLNQGEHTYFGQSSSCIDLSICTSNISLNASWSTERETLGSTHCIIEIVLGVTPSYNSLTSYIIPKEIEKSYLNKKLSGIFRGYKYTTRKEKRNGWKNFCSSINSNMTVSELWKSVRLFKGNLNVNIMGNNEVIQQFSD